jgi:hypothetical protein
MQEGLWNQSRIVKAMAAAVMLGAAISNFSPAPVFAARQQNAKGKSKRFAPAKPSRGAVPRVGVIKDYPATGLTVGCANLYFEYASRALSSPGEYVFLSRSEGDGAWMNLNGRDTRLTLLKTTIWHKSDGAARLTRYDYRAARTRVSVFIEPRESVDDYMFVMRIILLNGRSRRNVKAIGSSDC